MLAALLLAAVAAAPPQEPRLARDPAPGRESEVDRDGDGLPDFDELHKYGTDPSQADSDGDGIPDGDWDERREYAYTIRSVVDVCPPVTDDVLCDDFQDARILERAADHVRLEVVHYPFSTAQTEIPADPDWRAHVAARSDLAKWLAPGPTTNFDDAMRASVIATLAKDGIDATTLDDRTLVQKTSRWLLDKTKFEDGFTTYTATFADGKASVLPALQPRVDEDLKQLGRTLDLQWSRELFAKSMFEQRVHGSCTSTAILWNGVFRSLGIPTRTILMIPVVDASDPEELGWLATNLANHRVGALLREAIPAGSNWTNHTFNEVFVGGRWRRLNYATLGQGILDAHCLGLMTHVATVADWADGDFARSYGTREILHSGEKDAFGGSNPYSCVELADRFGAHARIDNPEVPVHRQLTITKLYWWSAPQRTVEMRLDDAATAGHLLFHVAESFADQGSRQYAPFYDAVDHDFVLRTEGHPDVPAHATRGFWFNANSDEREFYLRVEPADVAKIALDVAYGLVALNRKPAQQWLVAPGVTITRALASDPFDGGGAARPERALTLDACLWSDDASLSDSIQRLFADPPRLLAHVKSWDDFAEIKELTIHGDARFFLEAKGQPPLAITVGPGGLSQGSGDDRSAWVVFELGAADWSAFAKGTVYTLRAQNGKRGFRWIVADGAQVPARR